jgi:dTDP-4-dehydrorhamnose reductase
MKTVLVTGSNGLLGQKLTDLYSGLSDRKLVATGKGPSRHPLRNILYEELDICDPYTVRKVLDAHRPDTIIHTAAMTNVDACEADQAGCDALNVDAVRLLAEAADQRNCHFVHVSTDFIFDGEAGPYSEEALPAPLSYYGHSKLKGEEIVRSACRDWAILRTVLVYGRVADMSRSNIVLWARQALAFGKPFRVVNDQWRTPTLAEDLAMGCRLAELHHAQGIFHISGDELMSISELVRRVAAHYGYDAAQMEEVSSDTLNQAARRPPRTGFVIDKARRVLAYNPHSFEEGLQLLDAFEQSMQVGS